MADWYECFTCCKVYPLIAEKDKELAGEGKCATCGGGNGRIVPEGQFAEGFAAGVYYNLDPKTGKPAKKKRR
jgi:hypothetical protein